MKLALTGSSGLVGSAIRDYCKSADIPVMRIVRDKPDNPKTHVFWDYRNELFDWSQIADCDVVIHLAGQPLVSARWSKEMREEIFESRVRSTQFLAQCLADMATPPKLFITASAVGFYGDRDSEELTEESGLGEGFLTDVCKAWEAATGAAEKKGIRTVQMRLGMVISSRGGALPIMLKPFKMWAGGKIGSGDQYVSWIALPDLICALQFIIDHEELRGPVNLTSPNPVTNAEFTRTLGHVLHRPTVCAVPASVLKMMLGDMAREMLLASTRAVPRKLLDAGFNFEYADLQTTLQTAVDKRF